MLHTNVRFPHLDGAKVLGGCRTRRFLLIAVLVAGLGGSSDSAQTLPSSSPAVAPSVQTSACGDIASGPWYCCAWEWVKDNARVLFDGLLVPPLMAILAFLWWLLKKARKKQEKVGSPEAAKAVTGDQAQQVSVGEIHVSNRDAFILQSADGEAMKLFLRAVKEDKQMVRRSSGPGMDPERTSPKARPRPGADSSMAAREVVSDVQITLSERPAGSTVQMSSQSIVDLVTHAMEKGRLIGIDQSQQRFVPPPGQESVKSELCSGGASSTTPEHHSQVIVDRATDLVREIRKAMNSRDDAKLPSLSTALDDLLEVYGPDLPNETHIEALTVLGDLAFWVSRREAPPGRRPDMSKAREYLRRAEEVGRHG